MKVVLINPPSPFLIDQKAFPPLGLLYLASTLERNKGNKGNIGNNYDVEIIDLANNENDIEERLIGCDGDVYGITATTPQYPYAKKIKDILNSRYNNIKVIIGGAHPSSIPQKCIEDNFDYVVVGEGENAILRIVHAIEKGVDIERIVHCSYIKNLDSIPLPSRHLIDIRSYGYDVCDSRATTIITSRGCPFKCTFCSKDVWQTGVRYHSPEYVTSEVKEIIDKYGFRHFLFLDDSMTIDKKRLYKLCDMLEPLGIKWRCYARAKGTTRDILQKMKRAGCAEIGIGIESGSKKILDIVDKRTDPEHNLQLVKYCKDVGIKVNTFIMIGLPGETYQTVEDTKNWMERALPDKFGFNIFVPYIGTPIYNNSGKYDIIIHDMPDEHSWVKGYQEGYKSFVSTKELNRYEILRLFHELFEYYSNLTRWKPGIGKRQTK